MKYLIVILLFFCSHSCFSQDTLLRTFRGSPVDKNTCVFEIKMVEFIPIDTAKVEVRKHKIHGLMDYLKACDPAYSFETRFQDREFRLVIPAYLTEVSYELGDEHFAIVLRDTTSFERSIVFSYDLDDRYMKHFIANDNRGFNKTGTVKLGGQTIHRFINWDNRLAGTFFTTNHLHVSYFTQSPQFEQELQEAVGKFKW